MLTSLAFAAQDLSGPAMNKCLGTVATRRFMRARF